MSTKQAIRLRIREGRRALAPEWIAVHSDVAQRNLLDQPEFARARVVCAYLDMPGEVATGALLAAAYATGKTVAIPALTPERTYLPVRLDADTPIRYGPFQVPEPATHEPVELAAIDLVIVPGVAFDAAGGRLGHGRGHYDRLLAALAAARGQPPASLGLAFDFQIMPQIPMAPHDVRLAGVVTETRILRRTPLGPGWPSPG